MGPYCTYCDRRCFVERVLHDGRPMLLATCPAGRAHDRASCGQDHMTAVNPYRQEPPAPSEVEDGALVSALVVLVGAAGAGKSTWCAAHAAPHQVVSYDQLRQLVADNPGDQSATADAVELGERLIAARLSRRLLTVVDATNTSAAHRADLVHLARQHHVAAHAVIFTTPATVCQHRNAARPANRRVPEPVLLAQHAAAQAALDCLPREGFAGVHHACCQTDLTPCLLAPRKDTAVMSRTT